ncbi:hypothetical protein K443DRAFT_10704 [Laccaria amethystina LaAM-08-1]|uniref:Uncharacterized protein n=1 Tax=Laccaria amethystina LaAM-08-1 TaxID=1095629 RepID=A0A0C9WKH5_9AGAR|nr:hypothetical protein K443DRAFT_10704 [Laccaria amethystina LaAM-08-1]
MNRCVDDPHTLRTTRLMCPLNYTVGLTSVIRSSCWLKEYCARFACKLFIHLFAPTAE